MGGNWWQRDKSLGRHCTSLCEETESWIVAVTVGRKSDISELDLWPTGRAGGWLVKESRVSLWLPARMTHHVDGDAIHWSKNTADEADWVGGC